MSDFSPEESYRLYLHQLQKQVGLVLLFATIMLGGHPARAQEQQVAETKKKTFYPGVNTSITLGASWGDSGYRTPLDGAFSMGLRSEFHISKQERGWGVGLYAEVTDPGSLIDSRWLYGGGLMFVSPEFLYMGAACSMGVYHRQSKRGDLTGLTTGLTIGLRPRLTTWDFLLAARVDFRTAVGANENIVTVGVQLDLMAALALIAAQDLSAAAIW